MARQQLAPLLFVALVLSLTIASVRGQTSVSSSSSTGSSTSFGVSQITGCWVIYVGSSSISTQQCYRGALLYVQITIAWPESGTPIIELLSTVSPRVYPVFVLPGFFFTMPDIDPSDVMQPLFLRIRSSTTSLQYIYPTNASNSATYAVTSRGNLTITNVTGVNCVMGAMDATGCGVGSWVDVTVPNLFGPLVLGSTIYNYDQGYYRVYGNLASVSVFGGLVSMSQAAAIAINNVTVRVPLIWQVTSQFDPRDTGRWTNFTLAANSAYSNTLVNAIFVTPTNASSSSSSSTGSALLASSSSTAAAVIAPSSSSSSSSPAVSPYRVLSITGCQGPTALYTVSGCYTGSPFNLTIVPNTSQPTRGLYLVNPVSSSNYYYAIYCAAISGTSNPSFTCVIPTIQSSDYGAGLNIVDVNARRALVSYGTAYDIQSLGPAGAQSSSTGSRGFSSSSTVDQTAVAVASSSSSSSSSALVSGYRVSGFTGCQGSTSAALVTGCYTGASISVYFVSNIAQNITSALCLMPVTNGSVCYNVHCVSYGSWYVCVIPAISPPYYNVGLNFIDRATNLTVYVNRATTTTADVTSPGPPVLSVTSLTAADACWNLGSYMAECYTGSYFYVNFLTTLLPPQNNYYDLLSTVSSRVYRASAWYGGSGLYVTVPDLDPADYSQPMNLRVTTTDGTQSVAFPNPPTASLPYAFTSLGNFTITGFGAVNCTLGATDGTGCRALFVLWVTGNFPSAAHIAASGNTLNVVLYSTVNSYYYTLTTTLLNTTTLACVLPTVNVQDRNQWMNLQVQFSTARTNLVTQAVMVSFPVTASSSSTASPSVSSSQFSSSRFSSSSQFSSSLSSTASNGGGVTSSNSPVPWSLVGCAQYLNTEYYHWVQNCRPCDIITITGPFPSIAITPTVFTLNRTGSILCPITFYNSTTIQCQPFYVDNGGTAFDLSVSFSATWSYTLTNAVMFASVAKPSNYCGSSSSTGGSGANTGIARTSQASGHRSSTGAASSSGTGNNGANGNMDWDNVSNDAIGSTLLIIIIVVVIVAVLLSIALTLCALWCCCGVSFACLHCCIRHSNKGEQRDGAILGAGVLSSDSPMETSAISWSGSDASGIELASAGPEGFVAHA